MRILHISAFDDAGGASQAAYRLHFSLVKQGVDSQFFVSKKTSSKPFVTRNEGPFARLWENMLTSVDTFPNKFFKLSSPAPFSNNFLPGMRIPRSEMSRADIIHLHWLGMGHIHPRQIYSFNKPVVWRLPDMFAFTGGCHYSSECEGYTHSCGNCPKLQRPKKHDLSYFNWKRKKKYYHKTRQLTIVTPSEWLANCARKSSLLQGKDIVKIHTGVNTIHYHNLSKKIALKALGLEHLEDSYIIAFGAINATSDTRKGFLQLEEAILKLNERLKNESKKLCLLVIGGYEEKVKNKLPIESYYLGHLQDHISLNIAYNAADVFVVPSLEENLPNTGLEAMSCGTPVVSFAVGGMPELVDHKQNGYLAPINNIDALAEGIHWVLSNNTQKNLSEQARTKIEKKFQLENTTQEYIALYHSILGT